MWENFDQQIIQNIFAENRYLLYFEGLGATFVITIFAVLIGVVIGTLVALVKVYAKTRPALKIPSILCEIYLTVIRGTPVVVQLMILYFVFLVWIPRDYLLFVAALGFGINSGAYVAEIIRAGILAVDQGQNEAGRSLGLTNGMTMRYIIFPQAIKNILPALGNEFIVLFKETSVVSFIGTMDLTMAANLIRSRTFTPAVPLLFTALLYLIVVIVLTFGQRKLEKYLSRTER